MAEQVHVVDAVRAGDHSRDQTADLQIGVHTRQLGWPDMFGDQLG
ncbi:hypothetical protein [Frankia sp. CiP3]